MLALSIAGYLAVLAALVTATQGGAKLGARLFFVHDFRWFDSQPASAAWWRRFGVRSTSALASLFVCVALFWCGYFFAGDEVATTTVFVHAGPARDAGMMDGDRVVSIDGTKVDTWEALRQAVQGGRERQIELERTGISRVLRVTPDAHGRIGVAPQDRNVPLGFVDSAVRALRQPFRVISAKIRGATSGLEVQGPVGIVRATSKSGKRNAWSMFFMLGSLAANFWPHLAGLQLFDAATLWLFRKTAPAAEGDSFWRLARLQQGLGLALVSLVAMLALVTVDVLCSVPGLLSAMMLLLMPAPLALVPLTWLVGTQFWGVGRSSLIIVFGMLIPCIAPLASVMLLLRARRELRGRGFRLGWLVVNAPAEAYGLD